MLKFKWGDTMSNQSFTTALQFIGIIMLVVIMGVFVFGIIYLIRHLIKQIRKQPKLIVYDVMMILCILTVGASWIFNMGWYRVLLTWFAVPFVHPVIFVVINLIAQPSLMGSKKIKGYTLITYITYVFMYVFFPDGGDVGSAYVFFGLIHNDIAVNILGILSAVSLVAYIVFTILQLNEASKVKRKSI